MRALPLAALLLCLGGNANAAKVADVPLGTWTVLGAWAGLCFLIGFVILVFAHDARYWWRTREKRMRRNDGPYYGPF